MENAESFKGANLAKQERYSTSYTLHSTELFILQLSRQ